ncbi:transcription termination factor Rho [Georgenia halophila]|uniref:Transcription termination factor Rho n=1 Tax=Georgenia halophila TaxID=620889 RepID=A0ABP8KVI3_9MICO
MTETVDAPQSGTSAGNGGSLTTMRLPELQELAGRLGLKGTKRMRKSDLIAAIRDAQSPGQDAPTAPAGSRDGASEPASQPAESEQRTEAPAGPPQRRRSRRATAPAATAPAATAPAATAPAATAPAATPTQPEPVAPANGQATVNQQEPVNGQNQQTAENEQAPANAPEAANQQAPESQQAPANQKAGANRRRGGRNEFAAGQDRDASEAGAADSKEALKRELADRSVGEGDAGSADDSPLSLDALGEAAARRRSRQDGDGDAGQNNQGNGRNRRDDDDRGGPGGPGRSRRRNRDRNRDRKRRGRGGNDFAVEEPAEVSEDDVLLPVAGILDILDNYGFVRTSGYLAGANDVYVTMGQVKKNGLRRGDAITGAVRQPHDGDQQQGNRQKYNALVRLDTINGMSVEQSRKRPDFTKLTPLYPEEQLRLETSSKAITPRVIDLVAPIGKGQRGLIVSPPKAGKTIIMQQIANAITVNNPQVHLMVVLVDERPEEVTDFERMVKGEVISSTFDRPASDHTTVSELAIERAKRLVELGQDVVVLLDGITRLGRAYNLSAPASGRILSGGVDASALYPPKKFFGAARNIENGGSLTILATALVETGSKMDEVIFEEFKGTGNMELRLSRQLADKRIFPAVDVNASGTRREELLMGAEEIKVVWKLRRVMGALDQQQASDLLLGKLRETSSNAEFLMTVQKNTPAPSGEPELAIR